MSTTLEIPSFVKRLKIYNEVTYLTNDNEVTETMIVSFDFSTFEATCSLQSEKCNESLSDFDAVTSELFKSGEKWCNRDILQSVVHVLSKIQGWEASINRRRINCNRGGSENLCGAKKEPRKLQGGHLSGGCEYSPLLKPLGTKTISPLGDITKKRRYQDMWDQPIEITHASCVHNGLCTPSCLNRVAVAKSAGFYVKTIPTRIVFTLCNYVDKGIKLTHSLIKVTVRPI